MRKLVLSALGLAAALFAVPALAADPVTLQLKWVTQAQFAGY
jgi:NitT/TauT family transport system substrate-binding protein